MSNPVPHPRRTVFGALRASFLTGLVVVLPVGLTVYVIWAVTGWIDGWIVPLIPSAWKPDALVRYYLGPESRFPVRGVGVLVFLVFTAFIGWLARGLIGRTVIHQAETLVDRMPVVRSVYSGVKQITETFFGKSQKSFDRTCLVEFPRQGTWAVGMVAATPKGEIAERLPQDHEMIAVFMALTPLTSGMLLYVPAKDVIMMDLKPDEAIKLIVSAGLVYPVNKEAIEAVIAAQ